MGWLDSIASSIASRLRPDPDMSDTQTMPTDEETAKATEDARIARIDKIVQDAIENPTQEDIDYATQEDTDFVNQEPVDKTPSKKTSTQEIDPNDMNLLDIASPPSSGNEVIDENLPLLTNPNQDLETSDWSDTAYSDEDMQSSLEEEDIPKMNEDVVPPSEIIAQSEVSPVPHEKYLPEHPGFPEIDAGDELYDEDITLQGDQPLETYGDLDKGGDLGGGYVEENEYGEDTSKEAPEMADWDNDGIPDYVDADREPDPREGQYPYAPGADKDYKPRGWLSKTLDPSNDGLINKKNRQKIWGKLQGLFGSAGGEGGTSAASPYAGAYRAPMSSKTPLRLNPISQGGWTQSQSDFMKELYSSLKKNKG